MKCANCSEEFPKVNKKSRFCSSKCRSTFTVRVWRNKERFIPYKSKCAFCDTLFTTKNPTHRFCTPKCKNANNNAILKVKSGGKSYSRTKQGKGYKEFITGLVQYRASHNRQNLNIDYVISLYEKQKGKCALSGLQMTWKVHEGVVYTNISIDRIDQSKGYEEGNIRLVCYVANTMRWTQTDEELLFMCQKISKKLKRANVSAKSNSSNSPATSSN